VILLHILVRVAAACMTVDLVRAQIAEKLSINRMTVQMLARKREPAPQPKHQWASVFSVSVAAGQQAALGNHGTSVSVPREELSVSKADLLNPTPTGSGGKWVSGFSRAAAKETAGYDDPHCGWHRQMSFIGRLGYRSFGKCGLGRWRVPRRPRPSGGINE
jgi:hypothetical protein